MNKKIPFPIAIIIIVVCVILVGGLVVWQYLKMPKEIEMSLENLELEKPEIGNEEKWFPQIEIGGSYFWDRETDPRLSGDSHASSAIAFADSYLSEKLGPYFFENFIEYFPPKSKLSKEGTYYLSYLIKIPEKGIDYKTTTYPVTLSIAFAKKQNGFLVFTVNDIDKSIIERKFISRNEALSIVKEELQKEGASLPEEVSIRFNPTSAKWSINETPPPGLPGQIQTYCVTVFEINAITKEVSKETACTL